MQRKGMRWAAALALLSPLGGACSAGGSTDEPMASATGGTGGTGATGMGGMVTYVTGGATGQAPGGSSSVRDPSLFSWPEANPDGSTVARCQAGHYVGTYSCDVTGNGLGVDGGVPYHLTGPVDLRLEQSQAGELLSVSGGTLKSAAGLLTLDASLVGALNCGTGAFSGTLQNGTLSIWPFPPGGTFAGSLSATFVSSGPKLDGSWTLVGEGQFTGYSCTGPWTATWQAP